MIECIKDKSQTYLCDTLRREIGIAKAQIDILEIRSNRAERELEATQKQNETLRRACATGWGEPILINLLRDEYKKLHTEFIVATDILGDLVSGKKTVTECIEDAKLFLNQTKRPK